MAVEVVRATVSARMWRCMVTHEGNWPAWEWPACGLATGPACFFMAARGEQAGKRPARPSIVGGDADPGQFLRQGRARALMKTQTGRRHAQPVEFDHDVLVLRPAPAVSGAVPVLQQAY